MSEDIQVRIIGKNMLAGALNEAGGQISGFASGMVGKLAPLAAAFFSIKGIVDGLANADAMMQIAKQVETVSTSTEKATKALEFFELASKKTRSLGDELAKFYAEGLPTAMRKGFSENTFQKVVVQLDQVATAVGKSSSEIQNSFQQLMMGRASFRNPLLKAMGLDPKDIREGKIGIEELLPKIEALAKKGESLGDSFGSAKRKIIDAIGDAFSQGFIDGNKHVKEGLQTALDALTDPNFLNAIKSIGKAIAEVLPYVARVVTGAVGLIQSAVGMTQVVVGKFMSFTMTAVINAEKFWGEMLLRVANSIKNNPVISKLLFGAGANDLEAMLRDTGGFLASAGSQGLPQWVKDLDAWGEGGVDKLANGIAQITSALDPTVKAMDALDLSTKNATDSFGKLGKTGKDAVEKVWKEIEKDFGDAVAGGKDSFKYMAGGTRLTDAETINQRFSDQFGRAVQSGIDKFKNMDLSPRGFADALKAFDQAAERAANTFASGVFVPLSDTLFDLARNSGKNFGEIAARTFDRALSTSIDSLATRLSNTMVDTLNGGAPTKKGDRYYVPGGDPKGYENIDAARAASKGGQQVSGAFDMASIGFGGYAAGRGQYDGSQTQGLISGGMAGATAGAKIGSAFGIAGGVLGAVAGAIIGWASSYMGKSAARDEYKYGVPGIDKYGDVSFTGAKNMQPAEIKQYTAQISDAFDTFWNGYAKLAHRLGEAIPKLAAIDGKFQKEASGHFLKHLDEWINRTLPDILLGGVKGALKSGFGKIGMSGEVFDQLYSDLSKLDPKKALDLWNVVLTTFENINKVKKYFTANETPDGLRNGYSSMDRWGEMEREALLPFWQIMRKSSDEIMKFADSVQNMTGESRLRGWQQLSEMLVDYMEKHKAYLQDLKNLMDNVKNQAENMLFDLELRGLKNDDGTPDAYAQIAKVQERIDGWMSEVMSETDPSKLADLWSRIMGGFSQVDQLSQNLGPEFAEDIRVWLMDAVKFAESAFQSRIQQLGIEASEEADKFMGQFEPVFKDFSQKVTDAGTSIGGAFGPNSPVDETPERVGGFNRAVSDAAGALESFVTRVNRANVNQTGGEYGTDDGFAARSSYRRFA